MSDSTPNPPATNPPADPPPTPPAAPEGWVSPEDKVAYGNERARGIQNELNEAKAKLAELERKEEERKSKEMSALEKAEAEAEAAKIARDNALAEAEKTKKEAKEAKTQAELVSAGVQGLLAESIAPKYANSEDLAADIEKLKRNEPWAFTSSGAHAPPNVSNTAAAGGGVQLPPCPKDISEEAWAELSPEDREKFIELKKEGWG